MYRCSWCEKDEIYRNYHDLEWGKPLYDDRKLFEFLVLESFQAGLSWHTILKKRENFRKAFEDFDFIKIQHFREEEINILLQNEGIIRNKLKIKAAVNNAKRFVEVQREVGTFSNYVWAFVNHKPICNRPLSESSIPVTTDISDRLAKDLKKRGFQFLGSTTVYAFMQATGMVNDHVVACHCTSGE